MSWHKGERATVLGGLIIMVISLCYYTVSVPLIWDFSTLRSSNGLPLAADYATFWSASKLALSGKPADVYNIDELHKKQQQSLGSHHRHGVGWYYPPNFLLMVLPLGLMPYLISFFVWIIGTLILYLIVLYRISPHPILFSLLLFFPGIYENFMFGQNGFLTGTLLGGGLLLLDSYPVAAGCLLAFLSYKPQFIILVFPALICGRYWKTLAGAFTTSLLMLLISIMAFGYQVWIEYFQVMSIPMKQLEIGMAQWTIMPTFFAAVLSAGFGVKAAYLVQGVIMMAVVAGVSWVWCQKTSIASRGAALVLGTLLFTPYATIYDLAILALPLGWLWEEGRLKGRLPGELILLLFGWLLPIAAPLLWDRGTLVFTPYSFVYDLAILALPLLWLWEEGRLHGRLPGELILLLLGMAPAF